MAKKYEYSFTINIFPCQESYVDFEISAKERKLIMKAMDERESFEDVEKLSDLYERVVEAEKEKLREDVDLTGDDIDEEELDFSVDFGDEIDDE